PNSLRAMDSPASAASVQLAAGSHHVLRGPVHRRVPRELAALPGPPQAPAPTTRQPAQPLPSASNALQKISLWILLRLPGVTRRHTFTSIVDNSPDLVAPEMARDKT